MVVRVVVRVVAGADDKARLEGLRGGDGMCLRGVACRGSFFLMLLAHVEQQQPPRQQPAPNISKQRHNLLQLSISSTTHNGQEHLVLVAHALIQDSTRFGLNVEVSNEGDSNNCEGQLYEADDQQGLDWCDQALVLLVYSGPPQLQWGGGGADGGAGSA